jgi:benzodiazapine receptor
MKIIPAIVASTIASETATTASGSRKHDNNIWYNKLKKSKLTPPSWVFGYVWPILYSLMVVSFFIYVNAKYTITGIILFLTQLAINLTWNWMFFTQHLLCFSFAHLALLNIFVLLTYIEFSRASATASLILIPYMIWILFALYLNYYICMNN